VEKEKKNEHFKIYILLFYVNLMIASPSWDLLLVYKKEKRENNRSGRTTRSVGGGTK
jgi:hypothetical protein